MLKSWKLILGAILGVWILRVSLIPDPFKLSLSIIQFHENASDLIPTHVLIESDIWQSSISTAYSMDYPFYLFDQKIEYKKKKPLSLYKANKIYRFAKSLSKQYKVGKLDVHGFCCIDQWIEGEFIYGNATRETFTFNSFCSELGEEYTKVLFDFLEEESEETL